MRTTLDIDDDVLQAIEEVAELRRTTVGKVLSELARQALSPPEDMPLVRNGVPLLAKRPGERLVSAALVKRLGDLSSE